MKRKLTCFETNIIYKIPFDRVSSDEIEKYFGYILACDMIFFEKGSGKRIHPIKKYMRIDREFINLVISKYSFVDMIVFKPVDNTFDFSLLQKNNKCSRIVNIILDCLRFKEGENYITIGNEFIADVMYDQAEDIDYFQKRSFDVLKINRINPMLKNFGLVMKRKDINTQIIEKLWT